MSLFQFTLVLTASKARRDQAGIPSSVHDFKGSIPCCNPELYGILISILLQDLPFLCIRLMLIFKYHVVSYTNMFFTSKNSLVIILLLYRLIVINAVAKKQLKEEKLSVSSTNSPKYIRTFPRNLPRNVKAGSIQPSRSTPSVYALCAKNQKNGNMNAKHSGSIVHLSNTGSENSLNKTMANNNIQSHRLGLPVELINDKTGGSVGRIKAIWNGDAEHVMQNWSSKKYVWSRIPYNKQTRKVCWCCPTRDAFHGHIIVQSLDKSHTVYKHATCWLQFGDVEENERRKCI